MAEIEWKGVFWKAAYGNHSIKDLLTILKGFGPMEVVEFEKPGCFRGQISLALSPEGTKEITLYHLEVLGPKRKGQGRAALEWLKKTFKGELYVEDPGRIIRVRNADETNLLFWVRMFREGLIDALDNELCCLHPQVSPDEIDEIEKRVKTALGTEGSSA